MINLKPIIKISRSEKSYNLKANYGFTLVELIIYIALTSAVVTSLILWVLNLSGVRNKNYSAAAVEANRQFIASIITREIKHADAVTQPAAGASGATLELDRPGALPNAIFNLTAGILYLEIVGNAPVAVSDASVEITNLEFRNLTDAGDSRGSVWVHANLRYRDSSSNDFNYERELTLTASNRL